MRQLTGDELDEFLWSFADRSIELLVLHSEAALLAGKLPAGYRSKTVLYLFFKEPRNARYYLSNHEADEHFELDEREAAEWLTERGVTNPLVKHLLALGRDYPGLR